MSHQIEKKVIERFIIKAKRDRYYVLINSDKSRKKFTLELAHFRNFQYELFDECKGDERKIILDRIKRLGKIKDCYIISESSEYDKKWLDIDIALNSIIGCDMGTIIVFGDADIIYYEPEGLGERLISK